MSTVSHQIGSVVTLELVLKQDGVGVSGELVRVSLRNAVDNSYLDFSDNIWKASGWGQKTVNLVEFGQGLYQYAWNSWLSVKGIKLVVAEYEVISTGERAEDTLIFGFADVIESGRWKIINNQMIFYAVDGITPILIFNLFDAVGSPAEINVKERVPV